MEDAFRGFVPQIIIANLDFQIAKSKDWGRWSTVDLKCFIDKINHFGSVLVFFERWAIWHEPSQTARMKNILNNQIILLFIIHQQFYFYPNSLDSLFITWIFHWVSVDLSIGISENSSINFFLNQFLFSHPYNMGHILSYS